MSRRGLIVLGAGSFAAGCAPSADRTNTLPASDPGTPVEGVAQDRLRRPVPDALTRTVDLETGRGLPGDPGTTLIPREIRYPPTGAVEPLLSSPPGRAMLKLEVYNGDGPTAYFMTGADKWRVVRYPDLGLPAGFRSFWSDAWSGSLSPDGRFWGFPVYHDERAETRAAIVDLATLESRVVGAQRFNPYGWTADSELALDETPSDGVQHLRVLDPGTGRIRRHRVPTPKRVGDPVYAASGGAVRFTRTRGWPEGLTALEYDGDFTEAGETRLPLAFGRDIWARTALSSRHVAVGVQVQADGHRRPGVLIADRDWNPQVLLQGRRRGHPPRPHWIEPDVLLVHHGFAMRSASAILRYDCRSGSLTRVATIVAPSDPTTGLLVDLARDALGA